MPAIKHPPLVVSWWPYSILRIPGSRLIDDHGINGCPLPTMVPLLVLKYWLIVAVCCIFACPSSANALPQADGTMLYKYPMEGAEALLSLSSSKTKQLYTLNNHTTSMYWTTTQILSTGTPHVSIPYIRLQIPQIPTYFFPFFCTKRTFTNHHLLCTASIIACKTSQWPIPHRVVLSQKCTLSHVDVDLSRRI